MTTAPLQSWHPPALGPSFVDESRLTVPVRQRDDRGYPELGRARDFGHRGPVMPAVSQPDPATSGASLESAPSYRAREWAPLSAARDTLVDGVVRRAAPELELHRPGEVVPMGAAAGATSRVRLPLARPRISVDWVGHLLWSAHEYAQREGLYAMRMERQDANTARRIARLGGRRSSVSRAHAQLALAAVLGTSADQVAEHTGALFASLPQTAW